MISNNGTQRNPFVALCEYASLNNWCWKIFCTTCGHGQFSIALSKIARGLHPDDKEFWPKEEEKIGPLAGHEQFNDFWRNLHPAFENQQKLARIVAEAKIKDIREVAKFPDWLGYIGLVLYHCPNDNALKIVSESFIPQFVELYKRFPILNHYFLDINFKEKRLLTLKDLEMIEKNMPDS